MWATALVASAAAAMAAIEFARLADRLGASVPSAFVAVAAASLSLSFTVRGGGMFAATLLFIVIASGVVMLSLGPPASNTLARAAVLVLAPVYVGAPLGAVVWVQSGYGPAATSWLLGTIAVSDSAQYFTGRLFGRTKLAPSVSPGKTTEGAVGGLLAAGVAGAFLGPLCLPGTPAWTAGLVALGLSVVGMVGDLFESLLKRSAGAKDASHLIPGHGGVLDRLDSHLFAAPVFYLYLRYLA